MSELNSDFGTVKHTFFRVLRMYKAYKYLKGGMTRSNFSARETRNQRRPDEAY